MSFNWIEFFDDRGIFYRKSGKREALIECPFCTDQDGDTHMSVNLEGYGWKCWKRPREHVGKSEARLVQTLIGCSWEQAIGMVGGTALGNDFMSQVTSHMKPPGLLPARPLKFPREFKDLLSASLPSAKLFRKYLVGRGFSQADIDFISNWFDLKYCTQGEFKGRIIFPIQFEGVLQTWTGRSIYSSEQLRYRTLGADEGALGPISHFLLGWDRLLKVDADTLCLCEGPFDVVKVQVLGRWDGVVATCFFTSTASTEQLDLLYDLLPRFKYRYLVLDQGMTANAMQLTQDLKTLGVEIVQLPKLIKDPGELNTLNFLPRKSVLRRVGKSYNK